MRLGQRQALFTVGTSGGAGFSALAGVRAKKPFFDAGRVLSVPLGAAFIVTGILLALLVFNGSAPDVGSLDDREEDGTSAHTAPTLPQPRSKEEAQPEAQPKTESQISAQGLRPVDIQENQEIPDPRTAAEEEALEHSQGSEEGQQQEQLAAESMLEKRQIQILKDSEEVPEEAPTEQQQQGAGAEVSVSNHESGGYRPGDTMNVTVHNAVVIKQRSRWTGAPRVAVKRFNVPVHVLPPETQRLREFFGNVVLMINLDLIDTPEVHPDAVSGLTVIFLRQLYGRAFPRMVVVGQRAFDDVSMQQATDVQLAGIEGGSSSVVGLNYVALGKVEELLARVGLQSKGPQDEVEGVLWMDADVALNYWAFEKADKRKMWVPTPVTGTWQASPAPEVNTADPAPDKMSDEAQLTVAAQVLQQMPQWAKDRYKQNRGSETLAKGAAPLFYVPKESLPQLKELVGRARDAHLHAQLALPLILSALGEKEKEDPCFNSLVVLRDAQMQSELSSKFSKDSAGMWPVDLDTHEAKLRLLDLMGRGDSSLQRMGRRWRKFGKFFESKFNRGHGAPQ